MTDNGIFSGSGESQVPGGAVRLRPVRAKRRLPIPGLVLAILLIICGTAGVAVAGLVGVLPTWALVLVVAVDLVAVAGVSALLLASPPSAHRGRFWTAAALAVVVMVANLSAVKLGTDYLHFGHEIQAPPDDTVLYDVVVLADGPTDIAQLSGSLMGEVGDDPLGRAVRDKISKMVNVSFVTSTPWTNTVADLTASDVSSIVIQDGFIQVLRDANPDTFATLRILTSFEVDAKLAGPAPTAPSTTAPPPIQPGNAFVIYISGIDTYGNIANRARSDVNMLMVVNPDSGQILLVNTPRDFYVQLRGTTGLRDKLTHAGVYGINVSVGTLEDLYGITIDYYVRINFSSLVTVVDALGGIDVDSAYNFSLDGYTFVKGMNRNLSGAAALAFSRDRKDFAGGDRVRGENQQRVITAIIHKLSNPNVLVGYQRILNAVGASVQTSMPLDFISAQVKQQLTTNRNWTVNSVSVTGSDASEYTHSYPGQRLYVMVPSQSSVDNAKAQIQAVLNG